MSWKRTDDGRRGPANGGVRRVELLTFAVRKSRRVPLGRRLLCRHGPREDLVRLSALPGLLQAVLRQGQAAELPALHAAACPRGFGVRRAPASGHRCLAHPVRAAARRRPFPQELLRRARISSPHAEGGPRAHDVRPAQRRALREIARPPRGAVVFVARLRRAPTSPVVRRLVSRAGRRMTRRIHCSRSGRCGVARFTGRPSVAWPLVRSS